MQTNPNKLGNVFTQPLHYMQELTQAQFLSGGQLIYSVGYYTKVE